MALTFRQERLYQDYVDVWRPVRGAINATTKAVGDPSYQLVSEDVRCHIFRTREDQMPTDDVGRTQIINSDTIDMIHFEAGTGIGDAYALVLRTPDHPQLGQVWVTLSAGQPIVSRGGRRANYELVVAISTSVVPKGVTV